MLHRSKSTRSPELPTVRMDFLFLLPHVWSEKNHNPWNSGDTKNIFIEIGYQSCYRQGRGLHGTKGGNAHTFCNPNHFTRNSNHLKGDTHEQTRKFFQSSRQPVFHAVRR